jgi:hypothetical protein
MTAVDSIGLTRANNGVVVTAYRNSDGESSMIQAPETYVAKDRKELLDVLGQLLDRMEVR